MKTKIDFSIYTNVVIAFSGGKDSTAIILDLLEQGCPKDKMELWHHSVDGKGELFMDWAVTEDYCRAFAKAMDIPLYFSWKEGGFEREMNRENALTAPITFETPEGNKTVGGIRGKLSTRKKFPQQAASLCTRWCSAYLKVDVSKAALNNQERFLHSKTLFVTGERAQESAARAKYKVFEPHTTDKRAGRLGRHVDHYRPIHAWKEEAVWAIIERWNIQAHPAYDLGWGRLSCATCIFGSCNQWASYEEMNPAAIAKISKYEEAFGFTINRKLSVPELIEKGTAYPNTTEAPELVKLALSQQYTAEIFVPEGQWKMPEGAFGEATGAP